MLSLKARDIAKSIVVAIAASLLCGYIVLPLVAVSLVEAVLAIEKVWITDSYAKALMIIYGMEAADAITFGITGLLMGVLIGFITKNNRVLTMMLAVLLVTIIYVICYLKIILDIPQEYKSGVLIRLSIRFLLHMIYLGGCALLGGWLVSRRKRKAGQP
jgi:hypothetical protein